MDVYIFGKILNFYTFGRYYQDGRGSFPLFPPDQNTSFYFGLSYLQNTNASAVK